VMAAAPDLGPPLLRLLADAGAVEDAAAGGAP
jgi:hypothetical protein